MPNIVIYRCTCTWLFSNTDINPLKRDLSSWTYTQMRVAINNSTGRLPMLASGDAGISRAPVTRLLSNSDITLLEACREEFHRRLKSYNNWKARNATRMGTNEHTAPKRLLHEGAVPFLTTRRIQNITILRKVEVDINSLAEVRRVGLGKSNTPQWFDFQSSIENRAFVCH